MLKKLISHEVVGAFYLTMFSLLSPLTHASEGGSTFILMGTLMLCFSLNLYNIFVRKNKGTLKFLIRTIFVVGICLLFDSGFRPNEFIGVAFYNFFINGILTIYFLSFVRDYNLFLKSYICFAIISGFMHAFDPITGYLWSKDYMEFGFVTMLPAFVASAIAVFHFKYKLCFIPLMLFFLELLICANKGSLLTAILILILSLVYINNNLKLNVTAFVSLLIICLFLYLFVGEIFSLAIKIADHFGIDSYSLATIQVFIDHGGVFGSSSDTRSIIWEDAWDMYLEHPILGNGTGTFNVRYDGYEHNIFLEVLNSWGIIGITILCVVVYKSWIAILKMKDYDKKALSITFMILALVPLMVSMTFWNYQVFWAFLGVCFCYPSISTKTKVRNNLRIS